MSDRTCSIEGCERPHSSRGWCRAHYSRFQRYGDPTGSGKPISERRRGRKGREGCDVAGCERKHYGHGLCVIHYERKTRTGDVGPAGAIPRGSWARPPEERFWAKVNKTDTCWLWTGARMANGYGYKFMVRNEPGGRVLPHRYSYELARGEIRAGLEIDHMCHNPLCVNPEHLQAVTPGLNNENRSRANKNSGTGVRGVAWDKQRRRYEVYATVNRKKHYGGRYSTLEEAEAAAIALRNSLMTNNLLDRRAG